MSQTSAGCFKYVFTGLSCMWGQRSTGAECGWPYLAVESGGERTFWYASKMPKSEDWTFAWEKGPWEPAHSAEETLEIMQVNTLCVLYHLNSIQFPTHAWHLEIRWFWPVRSNQSLDGKIPVIFSILQDLNLAFYLRKDKVEPLTSAQSQNSFSSYHSSGLRSSVLFPRWDLSSSFYYTLPEHAFPAF